MEALDFRMRINWKSRLDGNQLHVFLLEPREAPKDPADRVMQVRVPVKTGPHDVAVAFLKQPSIREVESLRERFLRPYYLNGML